MKHLSKLKQPLANTLFLAFNVCFGLLFGSQDLVAQTKPSVKQSLLQSKDHALEEHKIILKKQLTYGQGLNLGKLSDAVTWTIKGPSGTVSGKGNALNDYVFAQAGNYEISLEENVVVKEGQDHHSSVPSSIQLKVDAVKMTFHQDELKLSTDIRKGVDTRGISMSIPVTIETLGEQKLDYPYTTVNSAGVGTNIVATLKAGTVLKVGKQTLEYELSGMAEKEAYIMFDFTDLNGQVQAVALKKPIQ